jgi:hypothetical protein
VKLAQRSLCKTVEAELVLASALMEAKEIIDNEDPDYTRGFLMGYYHCLKLADKLDAINSDEILR